MKFFKLGGIDFNLIVTGRQSEVAEISILFTECFAGKLGSGIENLHHNATQSFGGSAFLFQNHSGYFTHDRNRYFYQFKRVGIDYNFECFVVDFPCDIVETVGTEFDNIIGIRFEIHHSDGSVLVIFGGRTSVEPDVQSVRFWFTIVAFVVTVQIKEWGKNYSPFSNADTVVYPYKIRFLIDNQTASCHLHQSCLIVGLSGSKSGLGKRQVVTKSELATLHITFEIVFIGKG